MNKYLFWNVRNNRNISNTLCKLVNILNCDVFALAELHPECKQEILGILNSNKVSFFDIPQIGCERISIFTKFPIDAIGHYNDSTYYTFKTFPHERYPYIVLCFVHFQSQLHGSSNQAFLARQLKREIPIVEERSGTNNIIIVGDFNMDPFDEGIVSADAMHSIPSRKKVEDINRSVCNISNTMFYNPMWNFFGDIHSPYGSYYYSKSDANDYFWHIFDQVLVSPSLLNEFNPERVRIIDEIDQENSLISTQSKLPKADISDHLPLYFEL